MHQESLIIEDIYDGLRADIQAIGGSKRVGVLLWPEMAADKAGERLLNCLNRTRPEKLDPEQVLLVIREARKVLSRATITFICDDASYTKPEPLEPETEAAQLMREFNESKKALESIAKRLERLSIPVRAVRA